MIVPSFSFRLVVDDAISAAPKTFPTFKQYKTYSEEKLKEAMTAVLERGVRLLDASRDYKIPLTTLTRKIRTSRPQTSKQPDASEDT